MPSDPMVGKAAQAVAVPVMRGLFYKAVGDPQEQAWADVCRKAIERSVVYAVRDPDHRGVRRIKREIVGLALPWPSP